MTRLPSGRLADARRERDARIRFYTQHRPLSRASWAAIWWAILRGRSPGTSWAPPSLPPSVRVVRSLARSLARSSGDLMFSVAREHPGKRARGTTDNALVVHLSIFGPDGATEKPRTNDNPSRTHTTDDHTPPLPFAVTHPTLFVTRAPCLACARTREGTDTRRKRGPVGTGHGAEPAILGYRGSRTKHARMGDGPPCSRFVCRPPRLPLPTTRGHACQGSREWHDTRCPLRGPSAMTAQWRTSPCGRPPNPRLGVAFAYLR